jgi:hypothetical protein
MDDDIGSATRFVSRASLSGVDEILMVALRLVSAAVARELMASMTYLNTLLRIALEIDCLPNI